LWLFLWRLLIHHVNADLRGSLRWILA
jgi:hypothetical protein